MNTYLLTEYASSSDSDAETPVVDQAWRGDGDSDAESIDSDLEDPLKYVIITSHSKHKNYVMQLF